MSLKLMVDMSTDVTGSVELNESSGEKTYVISGNFSTPDKKNRNGRIYSSQIWESNVAKYQNEIKGNTNNTLMELEHPPRTEVNPWEAVAKIRKLEMREGIVYGEAVILNNNDKKTNQIKALIEAGVKIGVSTRGTGKMKGDIVEAYNYITTDIVANPSNYESSLEGFNESMILENVDIELTEKGQYICTPSGCSIVVEAKECDKNKKKNEDGSEEIDADEVKNVKEVVNSEETKKITDKEIEDAKDAKDITAEKAKEVDADGNVLEAVPCPCNEKVDKLIEVFNTIGNKADIEAQEKADRELQEKFDAYMGINESHLKKGSDIWFFADKSDKHPIKHTVKKVSKTGYDVELSIGDKKHIITILDKDAFATSKDAMDSKINEAKKPVWNISRAEFQGAKPGWIKTQGDIVDELMAIGGNIKKIQQWIDDNNGDFDVIEESESLDEARVHRVTKKQFDMPKFQDWIKKDLGDIESGKDGTKIYKNIAGKPVFSYNRKKEILQVIQNKLTIQDLVMYGLHLTTVVPMIEDADLTEGKEQNKANETLKKELSKKYEIRGESMNGFSIKVGDAVGRISFEEQWEWDFMSTTDKFLKDLKDSNTTTELELQKDGTVFVKLRDKQSAKYFDQQPALKQIFRRYDVKIKHAINGLAGDEFYLKFNSK